MSEFKLKLRSATTGLVGQERPEPKVVKIGYWYSRHDRAWVTQALDSEGNQVGEAEYDGHRKGRDFAVKQLMAKHGCNVSAHIK